ncbi:serine hydrolase domain-containing protein [Sphingomonas aerophila]|uniref:CubicO group peptidase (Beta-lactamase class C family) n=1 Tax=Sphingomonas aerophila TaxID=1344948 RepID=A0A7W9BGH3_9SPHN|nr:serine hydrolase domain-containing protein [Sphingomonas aerophila]MBB5716426.1 CubicO group peptidase (beta-lactamase class C family) [Sphingomonas aerophila]
MTDPVALQLSADMQGYVDRGDVPGLATLVLRAGEEVHCDVLGQRDFGDAPPLRRDALWRLGSMTKTIVSALTLMLVEDGRLRLTDPVDRWLPEFASLRVLNAPDGPLDDTRPARRAMTVLDLLTHRAGLPCHTLPQGPIGRAAVKLVGASSQRADIPTDAWIAELAALPLLHEPGERFLMGLASDVLGALIERVTKVRLPELLRERLFAPLGMDDTSFWAGEDSIDRLGPTYSVGWLTGKHTKLDPGRGGYWNRPPAHPSGGGGLIATIDDYARFGAMLLAAGQGSGDSLLSRASVGLMTTNFLTPAQRAVPFFGTDYWRDRGFGLGVFVTDNAADRPWLGAPGQYGWRGAFSTYWFNDPARELTAVLMAPVSWPAVIPTLLSDFERGVYAAGWA